MHPEIRQSAPGACPICGMRLVEEGSVQPTRPVSKDRGLGTITWKNYLPLIAIIGSICVIATIASFYAQPPADFSLALWIEYFMVGFFIVFAGFKLIDLKGFAEGYAQYDLIAKRFFAYGYAYPFIELAFGLLMLLGFTSPALLWTEAAVMAVSGAGVATKLVKREPFQCVCLGTFLTVPLTTVTLIEDFGMMLLAIVLIYL